MRERSGVVNSLHVKSEHHLSNDYEAIEHSPVGLQSCVAVKLNETAAVCSGAFVSLFIVTEN